jgi:hypothetical protein
MADSSALRESWVLLDGIETAIESSLARVQARTHAAGEPPASQAREVNTDLSQDRPLLPSVVNSHEGSYFVLLLLFCLI